MMGGVCAEQQHKFHHSHHLYLPKNSIREIDIPPRKLLARRPDMYLDSPNSDHAVFSKFLPNNNPDGDDSDDCDDPYSSDHFRMYEFKVRKCNRSRSHDWTDCPFAHPGEKARRRDPRRFHYSGTVCTEFRKGHCSKGDNCEYSHGVFECWLHPSRYRTEACKDGKNCKRKVCFFAHSTRQLRIVPETTSSPSPSPPMNSGSPSDKKYGKMKHCCACCHSMTASPTSTLTSVSRASPPVSPPISPVCSPEFALYGGDRYRSSFDQSYGIEPCGLLPEFSRTGGVSYKEALTELMASFEAMNMNQESATPQTPCAVNLPWLDVNFNAEEQPQFVLSPSTPMAPAPGRGGSRFFAGDGEFNGGEGGAGPDLRWVTDLLT